MIVWRLHQCPASWPRPWSSRPWATIVTAVTSATPIISAEAVTAVRPGLRIALSRASRPAAPPRRAAGRPTTLATARTPRANRRTLTGLLASRSAATGAIFVARRAGSAAARTVASVPTSSETTIVRVASVRPSAGRSMPIAVKIACRPAASPTPTPIPAADASRPISSASSSTLARTWRRVAPTIRSRPNSFVRCATVIDSELKIVKAPTSTATPAKASRTVRRMLDEQLERVEGEAVVVGRAADLRARHGRVQRRAQIGALLRARRGCGRSRPWRTACARSRGRRSPRWPCRAT